MDLDPHNPTLQADRAALVELRDLGMEMARYCVARAKADAEDGVEADRTPAFERVARGVRRAVFLLQHIATLCAKAEADLTRTQRDQIRARQQIIRDVEDATVTRPKPEADLTRTQRDQIRARQQIIRDVEDATVTRPKPERDALVAELFERLDAPEFTADLAGMTVAQASELIRRDFGLGQIFTHQRRTPADIEVLAARARHSAHAAALPDNPETALAVVLRHEADLRRQT